MPPYAPVAERFWAKVDRFDPDHCWEWTGGRSDTGYGSLNLGRDGSRRSVSAHRFAYELLIGPIPAGLVTDHLCRNRMCVNPKHLEMVSPRTNVLRSKPYGGAQPPRAPTPTHCPAGHPYTEANTAFDKSTHKRHCRTCHRERQRKYR